MSLRCNQENNRENQRERKEKERKQEKESNRRKREKRENRNKCENMSPRCTQDVIGRNSQKYGCNDFPRKGFGDLPLKN